MSRLGGCANSMGRCCIAKSRRHRKDESVETACESGEPELPAARLLDDQSYFWVKGRPGRVSVCADRSALNWFGSNPRACTVVGAICRVSNWFKRVEASYFGFETNSRTLREI